MKLKELLLADLAYLVVVTLAYFGLRGRVDDVAGLAQLMGTLMGGMVAIGLYQSRNEVMAPVKVKLTVCAALAAACLVQGLVFQRQFGWMPFADVGIGAGIVGAFLFPFVIWNGFARSVRASRKG